jgi:Na+/H+ antiporter NhaD/arsenite permease-like protein
MRQYNIRHILVADTVTADSRLDENSVIEGVISMQDVMSIIQKDERLSLESLQKKFPGFNDPLSQMREEIKSQANLLAKEPETVKKDIIRTGTVALSLAVITAFLSGSPWLHDHADFAMIGIFVLGYIGIIFEEVFEFNKAAIALLMSTGMWVTYADFYNDSTGVASQTVVEQLAEQLSEVSDICFFLLAASTIVEVVDAHQGFKVVTNLITTKSKKGLFWTIGFLTFFLSAILNNLTVTIVMVSLLRKLVPKDDDRKLFGAMVVVAANAGGVWTPIGDVTTTMLWINNNLSTLPTVTELFLPSIVCLVGSLAFLVNQVEEDNSLEESTLPEPSSLAARGQVVFWSGIACLLAVPVFSEFTGLPPYIAMLTGLAAMWTLTDIIHMGEEEEEGLKVPAALSKLDTSGILFFLGILMSIGVLDKSGLLKELAVFLNDNLPSQDIIATVIGIASALIDNVPLVAATMGMYDVTEFGTDDKLWQLIALCAGTGGSILIIGSASGVALMGLEKVDFLWYAKKVSVGAAVGYFAGIATYLVQNAVLTGDLFGAAAPQAMAAIDVVSQTVV